MLTTAVFAIVITAPLGAIMINTLGTKWLEYDGNDPELLAKHGKDIQIEDNLAARDAENAGKLESIDEATG